MTTALSENGNCIIKKWQLRRRKTETASSENGD